MTNTNSCNNCLEYGHSFHQCKKPITSLGIIVFKYDKYNIPNYLIICRKDSLGYVDFMRGKYNPNNPFYLQNIINGMTIHEKKRLLSQPFDTLWKELWGGNIDIHYKGEEQMSRDKYNKVVQGIQHTQSDYTLQSLIASSTTQWTEPEWGFPKGRRNYQEKNINCALREFEEETGYPSTSLTIMQNIMPLEEVFTGSNYKSYKHCYYIAHMDSDVPTMGIQKTEVSDMKWVYFNDAIQMIREYNIEKKNIIERVNKIICKYRIYI
uniref:Nudix hydrolase domain-containing protein n=1 Tax=viral metagenome TaxID=1070528 RepID=A0A6C0JW28_9ZZZZ